MVVAADRGRPLRARAASDIDVKVMGAGVMTLIRRDVMR
jgi:hypothetical protein